MIVTAIGALATATSTIIYDRGALALLAYVLGFVAAALAASNARQSINRAEQAELLLAQTQRSHEEQLRTTRLEESTRIAREIHDVLAHTLAGLTIQLEATSALIEHGADRQAVLERVKRAHGLAREGLAETRRAVGALRADAEPATPAAAGIQALVSEYRSASHAKVTVTIDGNADRLSDQLGQTLVRVVQEYSDQCAQARAWRGGDDRAARRFGSRYEVLELIVADGQAPDGTAGHTPAVAQRWGYGLRGMRERAEASAARSRPVSRRGRLARVGSGPAACLPAADRRAAVLARGAIRSGRWCRRPGLVREGL